MFQIPFFIFPKRLALFRTRTAIPTTNKTFHSCPSMWVRVEEPELLGSKSTVFCFCLLLKSHILTGSIFSMRRMFQNLYFMYSKTFPILRTRTASISTATSSKDGTYFFRWFESRSVSFSFPDPLCSAFAGFNCSDLTM